MTAPGIPATASEAALPQWRAHREPLRATLLRTGGIAVAVGTALAWSWGGIARWPLAALLAFWPALGGHWVEVAFLNGLRPRLPAARAAHVAARVGTWFAGGTLLGLGMGLTATALAGVRPAQWPAWWIGGPAFVGIELVVHAALQLRGRDSFYNGRG